MNSEALSKLPFIIITVVPSPTQLSLRNKPQMTLILFLSDCSSKVHLVSSATFCPFPSPLFSSPVSAPHSLPSMCISISSTSLPLFPPQLQISDSQPEVLAPQGVHLQLPGGGWKDCGVAQLIKNKIMIWLKKHIHIFVFREENKHPIRIPNWCAPVLVTISWLHCTHLP